MWFDLMVVLGAYVIAGAIAIPLRFFSNKARIAQQERKANPFGVRRTGGPDFWLMIFLFWVPICMGIGIAAAFFSRMSGDTWWVVSITVAALAFLAPFAAADRAKRKTGANMWNELGRIFSWISISIVLLLWLGLCLNIGERIATGANLKGSSEWGVKIGVGLVMFVAPMASLYFWIIRKYHDRHAARLLRRANEGDTQGAIAELRGIIDIEGPTQMRWHLLGYLLCTRESWSEADEAFREAERLGKPLKETLLSHARALENLGREEEALQLTEQAVRRNPHDMTAHIRYSRALARAGRLDEARTVFAHADEEWRSTIMRRSSKHREPVDREFADCRAFIEQLAPPKEDLRTLEEL